MVGPENHDGSGSGRDFFAKLYVKISTYIEKMDSKNQILLGYWKMYFVKKYKLNFFGLSRKNKCFNYRKKSQ